jgi:hypothetical protein
MISSTNAFDMFPRLLTFPEAGCARAEPEKILEQHHRFLVFFDPL